MGLRWWAGFIELGFIVIPVFGLISMFDKHYTTVSFWCQVNSWVFLNIFNHEGHEEHEDNGIYRIVLGGVLIRQRRNRFKKAGKMLKKVENNRGVLCFTLILGGNLGRQRRMG